MTEAVIAFENVSKYYLLYHQIVGGVKSFLFHMPRVLKEMRDSKLWVLKDLSFEVYRGEAFAIIGRNGVGKSTLLQLMASVIKCSAGRITVKGTVAPLLGLGSGFHPDLTGRENIIINAMILGMTKREVLRKFDSIVEFSELGEFIDQPLRIYSSGMLARLGFSVVTHTEPDILLVDEVLAVGDQKFRGKCKDRISEFSRKGGTIIIVSHDMGTVKSICDRAMWIENHHISEIGDVDSAVSGYMTACRNTKADNNE
ncbi:MAG: ABC transporter ATP-binding protein [Sedimentisphaerales bacterium]|nr:ABC transporter ATP-binding protein [Sedimentisphaerales bacterium]